MPFNIKIFLLCPIPEEQKPITQFINLKENSVTNFLTFSNSKFFKKVFFNFFSYFIVISLLRITDFKFYLSNINWLLINVEISLIFSFLTIYFIYNQWNSLVTRLIATRIFYEEASWFDGQIWDKPFYIIRNDRLIVIQYLKPILLRTIKVLQFIFFLIVSVFILLEFLKT